MWDFWKKLFGEEKPQRPVAPTPTGLFGSEVLEGGQRGRLQDLNSLVDTYRPQHEEGK